MPTLRRRISASIRPSAGHNVLRMDAATAEPRRMLVFPGSSVDRSRRCTSALHWRLSFDRGAAFAVRCSIGVERFCIMHLGQSSGPRESPRRVCSAQQSDKRDRHFLGEDRFSNSFGRGSLPSRHHIAHCAFSFVIRRFFPRQSFYRPSSV